MATQKRPVGISDKEWELVQKSHKTPHILLGEQRELALRQNPGLNRQLLEEEIKLAKHQRLRQQSIGIRLAEEELRRADRHWRYSSDTIQDVAGIPSRLTEAALVLAGGAGTVGAMEAIRRGSKVREKEAEVLGYAPGSVERSERNIGDKTYKAVIREGLETGRISPPPTVREGSAGRLKTVDNMLAGIPVSQRSNRSPSVGEVNEVLRRVKSKNPNLHQNVFSSAGSYTGWSRDDVIQEAGKRRDVNIRHMMESPVYKFHTGVSRTMESAFTPTSAIKSDAEVRAMQDAPRLTMAIDRLNRVRLSGVASEEDGVHVFGGSPVETLHQRLRLNDRNPEELRHSLRGTSLSDIEVLQRVHAPMSKELQGVSDALAARRGTLEKEADVIKGRISNLATPIEESLFKSRRLARGKIGIAIAAGSAIAVGGLKIEQSLKARKRASDIAEYDVSMTSEDPSQRVKKSWNTRRQRYGPSGESFQARNF